MFVSYGSSGLDAWKYGRNVGHAAPSSASANVSGLIDNWLAAPLFCRRPTPKNKVPNAVWAVEAVEAVVTEEERRRWLWRAFALSGATLSLHPPPPSLRQRHDSGLIRG